MVCDFHNHLIPGVDDGVPNLDVARRALQKMWNDGVRRVITTPHFAASLAASPERFQERLAVIDVGWAALQALAASELPELDLRRGAEVMLDTPDPDFSERRLRLDGGPFALVEFPYFRVPQRSVDLIGRIRRQGYTPVIAHPERYQNVTRGMAELREWRQAGALVQVNGPSVLRKYGREVERRALRILGEGLADYVSSDYHGHGEPEVSGYREALEAMASAGQATMLLELNPGRLLDNRQLLPVSGMGAPRGRFLRRVLGGAR